MNIASSAPGKVILLGEYCVLSGAPALVVAVDRRAKVSITSTRRDVCRLSSTSTADSPVSFVPGPDGSVDWFDQSQATRNRLFGFLIEFLSGKGMVNLREASRFDVKIDSTELYYSSNGKPAAKLGLGSSAAVTVALAYALVEYAGDATISEVDWLPILVKAHRRLQGGIGSGADIAASQRGGAVRYTLAGGQAPVADRLSLPLDLQWCLVWSGHSSSTPEMLNTLRLWRDQNGGKYDRFMAKLGDFSVCGLNAAGSGDSAGFLDAMNQFTRVLSSFDEQTGLGVFGAGHTELLALANAAGLVYKPCGAGGGDLGVVMGVDADRIKRFTAGLESLNFMALEMSVAPGGVSVIRS